MYKGSRLHELCRKEHGLATRLSRAVLGTEKGIDRYYKDGLNLTIDKLEKICLYTHKPFTYYLETEVANDDGTHPHVYGDNNIVNSPNANEFHERIEYLNKVIKLKDEIIASERANSQSKDEIIKNLKERINDLITLMQSHHPDTSKT